MHAGSGLAHSETGCDQLTGAGELLQADGNVIVETRTHPSPKFGRADRANALIIPTNIKGRDFAERHPARHGHADDGP